MRPAAGSAGSRRSRRPEQRLDAVQLHPVNITCGSPCGAKLRVLLSPSSSAGLARSASSGRVGLFLKHRAGRDQGLPCTTPAAAFCTNASARRVPVDSGITTPSQNTANTRIVSPSASSCPLRPVGNRGSSQAPDGADREHLLAVVSSRITGATNAGPWTSEFAAIAPINRAADRTPLTVSLRCRRPRVPSRSCRSRQQLGQHRRGFAARSDLLACRHHNTGGGRAAGNLLAR